MEGFISTTKPKLIDPNIMMQLEIMKNTQVGGENSLCSRIWTKLKTDITSFMYNNFWLLLIIIIIGYILWRRYRWYQAIYLEEKVNEEEKRIRRMEREKQRLLILQKEKEKEREKAKSKAKMVQLKEKRKEQDKINSDFGNFDFGTYDGQIYATC